MDLNTRFGNVGALLHCFMVEVLVGSLVCTNSGVRIDNPTTGEGCGLGVFASTKCSRLHLLYPVVLNVTQPTRTVMSHGCFSRSSPNEQNETTCWTGSDHLEFD